MKVDQRALAGIEVKVARADQHLRLLHDEMLAWNEGRPYHLIPEVHDDGRKHFYRLKFDRPIPVEWAVVLGEALHDLRSALDQCVYWLTIDWSKAECDGSAFPVCTSTKAFRQTSRRDPCGWARGCGMYKIRGIGPGPQAFIEALQPYPQRRAPYCSNIRALQDLWNQDKHRLVHLWGLRFGDEKLRLEKAVAPHCVIGIDRRVLHERAIAMRILCTTPQQHVKVMGQITADIAMVLWTRRTSGVRNASLWDVAQTNTDTVYKLLGALGRQDNSINLAVWSAPRHGASLP